MTPIHKNSTKKTAQHARPPDGTGNPTDDHAPPIAPNAVSGDGKSPYPTGGVFFFFSDSGGEA